MRNRMGKTALITGASSGIGEAFARELAAAGYELVLVARREDRLRALAGALEQQFGIRAFVVAQDLADSTAAEQIMSALARLELTVDMLVNNAGSGIATTFRETDWSAHAQLIQVQVTAAAQLTWLCLPGMLARGYGRIIHVASLAALVPGGARSTLYPAAKSFLVKFAESLSSELHGTGVHVCAVCPGYTLTEFHDVMGTRGVVSKLPSFMWQDAHTVAREALDAVERDEIVHVSGPVNRALAAAMRVLAPDWARAFMRRNSGRFRSAPERSGAM